MMQSFMVPVNGIRLHVQAGPPVGDPVLFIHFSSGHAGVWRHVLPYFAADYQVIAIDLRGHGLSDTPESGYAIRQFADDVVAVMDHLGVARAHLVGSSMGAEVTAAMAALYPERVLSLVQEGACQNPFGEFGEEDVPPDQVEARKAELRAKYAASKPRTAPTAEEAVRLILTDWGWAEGAPPALFEGMLGAVGERADGQFGLRFSGPQLVDYLEDFWNLRLDLLYEQVSCPVLFLPDAASWQQERVRASVDWFCSLIKGRTVVTVIPDSRHAAVVMEKPADFAEAVLAFYSA